MCLAIWATVQHAALNTSTLMNSPWVIIQMAFSVPSVLGGTSRPKGHRPRPVDTGWEEHDLSYERELR